MPFSLIVTHPGGAHKDEFLACATLLARTPVPIERREPTAADLDDPTIAVIDVGGEHRPERGNFDHHQFPRDDEPRCALSLVLEFRGLYTDARAFCDWLEPAEWFDCRGPHRTAAWLGISRDVLARLNSPIDITLLNRFARARRLVAGEPLWEMMRMIGEDLLGYLETLRTRLDWLEGHAEKWDDLQGANGQTYAVLFIERTDPPLEDPGLGLDRFIQAKGWTNEVVALAYPDRRGDGYGLTRFRDHAAMDFTQIGNESDVHFAHAGGFVAKTSAQERGRLHQLLQIASVRSPAGT